MRYYCVRQHDQRDCGLACLATIAKDYGLNMSLAYFRNLTKTDFNGVNIYGLVEAARKIGFDSAAYEIEFEDLVKNKSLKFPLIARIVNEQNFYHFVVINKIKNKKILISDPSKGKTTWLKDDFKCIFTGYVIVCTPNNQFEPRNEETKTAVFFKHLISENKKIIGFVCIISLLITFCGIVFSYGIRYEFQTLEEQEQLVARYGKLDMEIVEEEHKKGNTTEEEYAYIVYLTENAIWLKENLYQLVILLMVVTIIRVLLDYVRQRITVHIASCFSIKTYTKVTEAILGMPQSYLDNWKSGELIMRYTDAETISNGVISVTFTLIIDTVMAIVGAFILYNESSILFAITSVMIFLYIIIMIIFVKLIQNTNLKELEAITVQNTKIKEVIDSISDIKGYNIEKYEQYHVENKVNNTMKFYKKARKTEMTQGCLLDGVSSVCNIVLLVASFILISSGNISIGTYIAFMSLLDFFVSPVENLFNLQGTIQNGIVSAQRLSDVLDNQYEDNLYVKIYTVDIANEISISDVTFRYGNGLPVFEKLSCKIPVGKHTLIIGNNGVGKSTLAKLLTGVYKIEKGKILVNGYEINKIKNINIGMQIIYVSQTPNILTESIKENILFGMSKEAERDIEEVCEIVGLSDYIEKLPNKYNYVLEEQGRNLSTGQKQRLSIARALLRKPKILILDEATSNIDKCGESMIYTNIRNKLPDVTLISVMHDMNEYIDFDNIINI